MRSAIPVTTLMWLYLFLTPVQCARILAIEPFPCKSHVVVFSALTRELARRGHELVVVSPFPLSKPMPNYTDIDIMPAMRDQYERMVGEQLYQLNKMPKFFTPLMLWRFGFETCETVLRHPEVLALLNDKRGFDLVIVEAFTNEATYAFADYFKAPLVLLAPFGGFHLVNNGPGNPYPYSYVPNPTLDYSDRMNFLQRIFNTLYSIYWNIGHQLYYLPRLDIIREKVFTSGKNIWELEKSASLTLLNNHFSLNYPRPLVPAIVEVGGLHVMRKNNKLPDDIQKFLDSAIEGAIYFSMGSTLRSNLMPVEKRNEIMAAFSELPQRVLWKWESEILPEKLSNVKTGKWLPQQDILAHPNVRLFITHGGLLSAQEAIYHGVPLLGIPVYGDQFLNVLKSELGGYGLKLDLKNVSKESVLWAVNKILHDPSYHLEAQKRSAVFRDQPESPLDRAVFWTEYVLRHKGAPHLRSAATRLAWYQLYLLDVAAVLLLALGLVVYIIRILLKLLCRTKNAEKDRKEKKRE